MPRKPRQESLTGYYHVTTRGLNKELIFNENREKSRILNIIRENYQKFNVKIFAYCIMQNHIHLLVKSEKEDLSSFMAKILAEYAKYYNYKHKRVGYVFQGRFHSQCIESEEHFWNCLRYIHLNPLKAKMCKNVQSYRYSSAQEYFDPAKYKKGILSSEGYDMNVGLLDGTKAFEEFHRIESSKVFADIPEEELMQQKEIARMFLENISKDFELSKEEILDWCDMRNLFESIIANQFEISKRAAKKLQKLLREEMRMR
ncbi:REP-associated tyrosine transposase [Dorea phocaeensis]|uniref:REP-associated tyrosine transposase n=1 Tax=Dorea phocaeensis TaxID=2040291 RepID=UPI0013565A94|nr:transposase [Dorea phocaeensis]